MTEQPTSPQTAAAEAVRRWLLTHPGPAPGDAAAQAAWAADAASGIVEALGSAGHLTAAQTAAEDAARWLAEQCGSPRYGGDRWRLLLDSEADVTVALTAAAGQPGVSRQLLTDARTVLISNLRATGGGNQPHDPS